MTSGAVFSPNNLHRLVLWRKWSKSRFKITFIGINPSTAGKSENDQTITKLIEFSKRFGAGGFYIINLCTRISTDSDQLKVLRPLNYGDPNHLLQTAIAKSAYIVPMWGNKGSQFKDQIVRTVLMCEDRMMFTFGLTSKAQPGHPLMLSYSTELNRTYYNIKTHKFEYLNPDPGQPHYPGCITS
jgi:hypothetical protein